MDTEKKPASSGNDSKNSPAQNNGLISAPAISLPKGGGAIRGMGEKFGANPVTGTGSMTVPIATSPSRSGFGPQLALSYDSGSGNGPFGFGWSLSIPSITRKTDKGLPQYRDAEDSDVFILSGAEDLVPVLKLNGTIDEEPRSGFLIRKYRPRIEGLFARIERWTRQSDGDTYWRSISKDNITTFYGKTDESRIADPTDPTHIFSWLICESYDDKGNAVSYEYKEEDSDGVDSAQANEKNRTDATRSANRYLKRIKYCNLTTRQPGEDLSQRTDWRFEVVIDYGEHYDEDLNTHQPMYVNIKGDQHKWSVRNDPFSAYRSGFEVRTYRLCKRVLMFHHFPNEQQHAPDEPALGNDCLVRSTDFEYKETPIATYLTTATHSSYRRTSNGFNKKSLPKLEFTYSEAIINDELKTLDSVSMENLPYGLDGARYQWTDLYSEGISGVLTEQADTWFYKPNLSPGTIDFVRDISGDDHVQVDAQFAPLQTVARKPSPGNLDGGQQLMDLAGDGDNYLVQYSQPLSGYFKQNSEEGWQPFVPFKSFPNINWSDPNLKFIELTGDGHADLLISEDDVFYWYRSLATDGFAPAEFVRKETDEEKGPQLVFVDGTQSVYLADMSGDGLTDIARIRNGEVCYWPNLGYGRFGMKVTMDMSPRFDSPDQFDQKRIRLADIDGSGTTDIIYLGRNEIHLFFNQSGNSWKSKQTLAQFPQTDNLSSVNALDLLGNGTACLVWSSPLTKDARQPMRYIDLMGGQKPHLLIKTENNLGAETRVRYVPSTKFYLKDRLAGKPWITKLPFPVHVIERVETFDRISRNWFVTRYAYHHGYYDGVEREFRGFGMVEQWDTEEYDVMKQDANALLGQTTNIDGASHVPPVLTKTWFHTGVYLGRNHISNFFAGLIDANDVGEYYRDGLDDDQSRALLLDDTILPDPLSIDEEREACRALKGSILRQEIYVLDGTSEEPHPYTVSERNYTIELLQSRGNNKHAVFFTHPRETLDYHYERHPQDPRISHSIVLDVDDHGNVLKSVAIGYGRRSGKSPFMGDDKKKQEQLLITYTESDVTNAVDDNDIHRTPLPYDVRTYELTGFTPGNNAVRFTFDELAKNNFDVLINATEIQYEGWANYTLHQKRLVERVRTLFRKNDLTGPALPPNRLESLALPYESYKLAFTPGLLSIYQGKIASDAARDILINRNEGGYLDLDNDGRLWIPSGRMFYSPDPNAAETNRELTEAQNHFFLPRRYRDPFFNSTFVEYDDYDLLVTRTSDPLDNKMQAENNYRVLQPWSVTDPNGNRSELAFDTLGLVVGTAVIGRNGEGDSLQNFKSDLTQPEIDNFFSAPRSSSAAILLKDATTRIVYDIDRYARNNNPSRPTYAATIARETHLSDLIALQESKIQVSFSYSDGFGREIQKKIQAEPGPVVDAGPVVDPRWVGSGWTIFNNKGKPVKQHEPFFDDTHDYKFGNMVGVSPTLFYDPAERVVATLHPNHTYEKVVFDPWQQTTWDVNDTLLLDPAADDDVKGFFSRLQAAEYLPTWYDRMRTSGDQDERNAASRTAAHANTPTIAHFDALGRAFLSIADNGTSGKYETRTNLDIEGNPLEIIDARDRIVMEYLRSEIVAGQRVRRERGYDVAGNQLYQKSMEAGTRWILSNVAGKPIRSWDDRNFQRRMTYDALLRPTGLYVGDNRPLQFLAEKTEYGESKPDPESTNHRGKAWKAYDHAGIVENMKFDFKGNLFRSTRNFLKDYSTQVNWSSDPQPQTENELFASSTQYDALNRPLQLVAPHSSNAGTKFNIIRPAYNEANLLEKVDAWLNQDSEPLAPSLLDPSTANFHAVKDIDYNAKGQRESILYGNEAITKYKYDDKTFRLTSLLTSKGAHGFQYLRYTYDPVGNITHIQDDAQQTIYFNGQVVEPHSDYVYDAIYRLIRAEGREHIGQATVPTPPSWDDKFRVNLDHPHDGQMMRAYVEQYDYDSVENFLQMIHTATNGNWTRDYAYESASLIELAKKSNRLTRTTIGSTTETYTHDAHGNMTSMPHLQTMNWNFKDELRSVDLGGGGTAYYVYDAGGQRVRKVWEKSPGLVTERLYIGGFEIYRERGGGGTVMLERESLHIMDDKERIALVETQTIENSSRTLNPKPLTRFQLSNHLGSCSLELDDTAKVISYEEYYPYGNTSYQAMNKNIQVSAKRYRYTGQERDEESGLYYHGARYYAPWLAKWTSTDPEGLVDGPNQYAYTRDNPINFVDPSGTDSLPDDGRQRSESISSAADDVNAAGNVLGPLIESSARNLRSAARVTRGLAEDLQNANNSLDSNVARTKETNRRAGSGKSQIRSARASKAANAENEARRLVARTARRYAESANQTAKVAKATSSFTRLLNRLPLNELGFAAGTLSKAFSSTNTTQAGITADALLTGTVDTAFSISFPVIAELDAAMGLVGLERYQISGSLSDSVSSLTGMGESLITGDVQGISNFHESSIKGNNTALFRAVSEAGEYWSENGGEERTQTTGDYWGGAKSGLGRTTAFVASVPGVGHLGEGLGWIGSKGFQGGKAAVEFAKSRSYDPVYGLKTILKGENPFW